MQTSNLSSARRYDIDWLRIALIASVFFFHIGMFFNGFGWHIKNNTEVSWLNPLMAYLHRWRMPLIFFVSGVGTYYALGRKNIWQYVKERHNRLMIPLLFGVLLIVPPQVYIEKSANYSSYLDFIPHIFDGVYPSGNFSWHHLWFILYLFLCSIALIPVILLYKSKFGVRIKKFFNRFFKIRGSLLLLSLPLYIEQLLLRSHFEWETHALVNDWAYWAYNLLFFIYGYILYSDKDIIQHIVDQRKINAAVAFLFSGIFFYDYYYSINSWVPQNIQLLLGSIFEWSIGITLLGYFAKYLNKDLPIRKYLNEGIYPFYILHQTVIIIVASQFMHSSVNNGMKALIITSASLAICVSLYWFAIRPFNFTRVMFGMRMKKQSAERAEKIVLLRKAS